MICLSGVVYQLRRIELADGQMLFSMWVSRDPEDMGEANKYAANFTLASSLNSTMDVSSFMINAAEVCPLYYIAFLYLVVLFQYHNTFILCTSFSCVQYHICNSSVYALNLNK